jgi:hypothetical protein
VPDEALGIPTPYGWVLDEVPEYVSLTGSYGLAVSTICTILRRDEETYHQESLFD